MGKKDKLQLEGFVFRHQYTGVEKHYRFRCKYNNVRRCRAEILPHGVRNYNELGGGVIKLVNEHNNCPKLSRSEQLFLEKAIRNFDRPSISSGAEGVQETSQKPLNLKRESSESSLEPNVPINFKKQSLQSSLEPNVRLNVKRQSLGSLGSSLESYVPINIKRQCSESSLEPNVSSRYSLWNLLWNRMYPSTSRNSLWNLLWNRMYPSSSRYSLWNIL